MDQIAWFESFRVGHQVKVKGNLGENGVFVALEVKVKAPEREAVVEGLIQSVDQQKNSLCLLNRDFVLLDDVKIKDIQRNIIDLEGLQVGDMVKLTGEYTASRGFVLEKIKVKEPEGFHVDELQGDINTIDLDKKTLDVVGFSVMVHEKTTLKGF